MRSRKDNLKLRFFSPVLFKDCIESIWLIDTFEKPHDILVPPDQFVYLVFPLSNNGFYHSGNYLTSARIDGITLKNVFVRFPPFSKVLGVRMYASGLYPFIPQKGENLFNRNIPFPIADHNAAMLKIKHAVSENECIMAVSEMLSSMYSKERDDETHLGKTFYFDMIDMDSSSNIQQFCLQNNTNYTTLNRAFRKLIGISAKKFERLMKFRKALNLLISSPDKLVDVSVNSGYFDQSHFIKEFKHYMNMSPSDYLRLLENNDQHFNYKWIGLSIL